MMLRHGITTLEKFIDVANTGEIALTHENVQTFLDLLNGRSGMSVAGEMNRSLSDLRTTVETEEKAITEAPRREMIAPERLRAFGERVAAYEAMQRAAVSLVRSAFENVRTMLADPAKMGSAEAISQYNRLAEYAAQVTDTAVTAYIMNAVMPQMLPVGGEYLYTEGVNTGLLTAVFTNTGINKDMVLARTGEMLGSIALVEGNNQLLLNELEQLASPTYIESRIAEAMGMSQQRFAEMPAEQKQMYMRMAPMMGISMPLTQQQVNDVNNMLASVYGDQGDRLFESANYAGAVASYEKALTLPVSEEFKQGLVAQIINTFDAQINASAEWSDRVAFTLDKFYFARDEVPTDMFVPAVSIEDLNGLKAQAPDILTRDMYMAALDKAISAIELAEWEAMKPEEKPVAGMKRFIESLPLPAGAKITLSGLVDRAKQVISVADNAYNAVQQVWMAANPMVKAAVYTALTVSAYMVVTGQYDPEAIDRIVESISGLFVAVGAIKVVPEMAAAPVTGSAREIFTSVLTADQWDRVKEQELLVETVDDAVGGVVTKGQNITLVLPDGSEEVIDGEEYENWQLIDLVPEDVKNMEGFKESLKKLTEAGDVLPYEVSYAIMEDGTVKFSTDARIVFNADGSILLMSATETVARGDKVMLRGHTEPEDEAGAMVDAVGALVRSIVYERPVEEHIITLDKSGKASVSVITREGDAFVRSKLNVDGTFVRETAVSIAQVIAAIDKGALEVVVGRLSNMERGAFVARINDILPEFEAKDMLEPAKMKDALIRTHVAEMKITRIFRDLMLRLPKADKIDKVLPGFMPAFLAPWRGVFEKPAEVRPFMPVIDLTDQIPAMIEITRENEEIVNALTAGILDANKTALERMRDLTELLQQAGVFTGKVGIVVDARSEAFDAVMMAKQMNMIAPESPIVPVIVVDSPEAMDKLINETGISADRIVIEAKEGFMLNTRNTLRERGVFDMTQVSFAMAATPETRQMITGYYNEATTKKDVSNFLFATKEAAEYEDNEQQMLAGTLLSALIRISQKQEPTFMGIGCDDYIDDLQIDLAKVLRFALNFVRIQSQNFVKMVGDFLNAVAQTDIAL